MGCERCRGTGVVNARGVHELCPCMVGDEVQRNLVAGRLQDTLREHLGPTVTSLKAAGHLPLRKGSVQALVNLTDRGEPSWTLSVWDGTDESDNPPAPELVRMSAALLRLRQYLKDYAIAEDLTAVLPEAAEALAALARPASGPG